MDLEWTFKVGEFIGDDAQHPQINLVAAFISTDNFRWAV